MLHPEGRAATHWVTTEGPRKAITTLAFIEPHAASSILAFSIAEEGTGHLVGSESVAARCHPLILRAPEQQVSTLRSGKTLPKATNPRQFRSV